ncbi:unnamed protein product, partial [Adineta steineri]
MPTASSAAYGAYVPRPITRQITYIHVRPKVDSYAQAPLAIAPPTQWAAATFTQWAPPPYGQWIPPPSQQWVSPSSIQLESSSSLTPSLT